MIESLHIENFRCFPKLDLQNFGRFNIIVGDNGSGKTSLLEAIFFPGSSAQIPIQYRTMRGMLAPGVSNEKEQYESLFNDLFYGFAAESHIEISLNGSYENLRKAKIYFAPISEMPLFREGDSKAARLANRLFTVQTVDADNHESIQRVNLTGNLSVGGSHKMANISFASSSGIPNPMDEAQAFSDLRKNNEHETIVKTVRSLFPQISELSVELTGGGGELYCKVANLPKRVPVSLASNGLYKILFFLLQISGHKNGIVLIDEIENGIYHKRFPKIWEAIIQFCNANETQVFVTTHSKECLTALIPFIESNKSEFRLIRTTGENGAGSKAQIFKGENFVAALETGTEIR